MSRLFFQFNNFYFISIVVNHSIGGVPTDSPPAQKFVSLLNNQTKFIPMFYGIIILSFISIGRKFDQIT